MELIIEKLKKIRELSERGVGGEAKAAAEALEKMLAKYGLTIESLSSETRRKYIFKAKEECEQAALFMCIVKIGGFDGAKRVYRIKGDKAHNIVAELTEYEFAEVSLLYEFHKKNIMKEFKKTLKSFQQAYQYKHRLYTSNPEKDSSKVLSGEEISRLVKYASEMEDVHFQRAIGTGKQTGV
jgi:hypothetical protein